MSFPKIVAPKLFATSKSKKKGKRNFSTPVKGKIWDRQRGRCDECDKELKHDQVDFDHIKPWSEGGPSTAENGRALCSGCHAKISRKQNSERAAKPKKPKSTWPKLFG